MTDALLHLPYTESADEEFQGPNGDWFCHLRAITLDNWLIWRDALPEPGLRQPLTGDIASNITSLAAQVHLMHQKLPNYRLLYASPFVVSRWWDPLDADDHWRTGRAMLCRVEGYPASDLIRYASRVPGLLFRACSHHWVELRLDDAIEPLEHSLIP